jgi:hypothetical protein
MGDGCHTVVIRGNRTATALRALQCESVRVRLDTLFPHCRSIASVLSYLCLHEQRIGQAFENCSNLKARSSFRLMPYSTHTNKKPRMDLLQRSEKLITTFFNHFISKELLLLLFLASKCLGFELCLLLTPLTVVFSLPYAMFLF